MPLIFVFDMDGTLVDNMRLKAKPFVREMHRFGISPRRALEHFLLNVGLPHRIVARELFAEHGKKVSEKALLEASARIKQQWQRDIAKTKLRTSARQTLETLRRAGHVVVVSSSSYPLELKVLLQRKRIAHLFDGVLGYSDRNPRFIKGKVHNEIARRIAAKKGVSRSAKLVYVGDGLFDMRRTRESRGAVAVGITGSVPAEMLAQSGAHHVINDLKELIPLSRRLARK